MTARPAGEAVFAALLRAYPRPFRARFAAEMAQVFRDQRRAAAARGRPALAGFWLRLLAELGRTAFEERLTMMTRSPLWRQAASAALLVVPVVFLVSQMLVYELKVPGLSNPFDVFYNRPGQAGVGYLMDAFIFLGPLVALALALPLFLRQSVRWRPSSGTILTVSLTPGGLVAAALTLVGLGLSAVFVAYLVAENLPCLLGAAAC